MRCRSDGAFVLGNGGFYKQAAPDGAERILLAMGSVGVNVTAIEKKLVGLCTQKANGKVFFRRAVRGTDGSM